MKIERLPPEERKREIPYSDIAEAYAPGFRKTLNAPWELSVTHSGADNPGATFSKQPRPGGAAVTLAARRAGIATLARVPFEEFTAAARQLNRVNPPA